MGKMVQICNLLNYVKFIFGLIFGVYLQHKCLIYEFTDFGIWQKRNSTYSVT